MIQLGLLNQGPGQSQHADEDSKRLEAERQASSSSGLVVGRVNELPTIPPLDTESKLNKLLQTPRINKTNYVENYKLICSSTASINTPNKKSVIRKGPNSSSGSQEASQQ